MTPETIEHKTHELRVQVGQDPDHPLIVETRDNTHSADLSYAIESGKLKGEPRDLALNREQLNWLTGSRFNQLQQQAYGKVHVVAAPITPGKPNEIPEPISKPVKADAHTGDWRAAVAAGETEDSYVDWMAARAVVGYRLPVPVHQMLMGITTDADKGAIVTTIKQSLLMATPILEVKDGS